MKQGSEEARKRGSEEARKRGSERGNPDAKPRGGHTWFLFLTVGGFLCGSVHIQKGAAKTTLCATIPRFVKYSSRNWKHRVRFQNPGQSKTPGAVSVVLKLVLGPTATEPEK